MTDYFAYFDLPALPTVDQALLKRRFYANSKRFHPDFHTLADAATQDEALEQSTRNNRAYKTLADDDGRLRHLLELRGALGAEGTNQVPQDFLLEIMDVNEALMELEFDDDPAVRNKVTGLIDQLEADLARDAAPALSTSDPAALDEATLATLADYYLKRRYLLRLRQKI